MFSKRHYHINEKESHRLGENTYKTCILQRTVTRIYKELSQFIKKTTQPGKKMDTSPKTIYIWQVRSHKHYLSLRKCDIKCQWATTTCLLREWWEECGALERPSTAGGKWLTTLENSLEMS